MIEKLAHIGRLAFREEGDNWNCYFARDRTMKGAILLGSIRMSSVLGQQQRKKQFMDLMRDCFDDHAKRCFGFGVKTFETEKAPEHERTKRHKK